LILNDNGIKFAVDIVEGQKTGFFLDQRANRAIVASYAKGARVLDCFSYTGGFSVSCAAAGAVSVTAVDSSAKALERLRSNASLNGAGDIETFAEDVFDALRRFASEKRRFDLVILDPPKLAPTRASLDKALRAYKDLAMRAFLLLEPGGTLATFSCSGGVSSADLQKAVAWGALDAGRQAQIVRKLSQDCDHPILLSYPESEYLKGFVIKVI
jgi:23S rRNA (cytosine1962-C5)-methyltransferase